MYIKKGTTTRWYDVFARYGIYRTHKHVFTLRGIWKYVREW